MLLSIGILLIVLLVGGTLFINLSPQFGKNPSKEEKVSFAKYDNYKNGRFFNTISTNMNMSGGKMWEVAKKFIFESKKEKEPKGEIPVFPVDSLELTKPPHGLTRVTWFGHSAFLLEIDGKIVLIDPMLGEVPSPVAFAGNKRYSNELPIEAEKLPEIDAVIFSHDHYDHLDYGTILKIKDKVKTFFVPLGIRSHLEYWGVDPESIVEMNWWEETEYNGLNFICTPARHFSGRGLNNRFSTLWASWIIRGQTANIFFSGDSGYGPHFNEIGEKYGPFDFAMLECGQYNEAWHDIHMMPEETVQASIDLQAKTMMPIHWGAFTLALHHWTDPVERASLKAKELNVKMSTPRIGEPIIISDKSYPDTDWWKSVK